MAAVPHPDTPVVDDDPYAPAVLADPYPLFARMLAEETAVWLPQYAVHAFTHFDAVHEILVDHETFISGAGVGPVNLHVTPNWRPQGILESDPPRHTPMREAMTGVIAPRKMRALRPGFDAYAAELVDALLARGEADLVHDFAEPFTLRMFGDAVGIPREGREEHLVRHGAMNFSFFGPDNDLHRRFVEDGLDTVDYVMANCARERLTPDGMGAAIWAYADRGVIEPDMAVLLVRAMLSAGLDTTIQAISITLKLLAEHPAQWAKVHAAPARAKFAIDEALRFDAPFQSFFRTTSRDVEIDGVRLAAGSKLLLLIGAANRDPRRWGDDADAFDIDRNAGGQLSFGMGIHQCVGQPISRQESDALITALAERVATLELTAPPTPFVHNTLKGWTSVPARVAA
ncbi:MAG: cytochrome P450 [Gaiellales bacterium]